MSGLKDHEARELINAVNNYLTKKLVGYKLPQCLRMLIHDAVIAYLNENNLRVK